MTPLIILKKARRLLSKPERWAKGHSAYDAYGGHVNITAKTAVKFCAVGAIVKSAGEEWFNIHAMWLSNYLSIMLGQSIVVWNDHPRRTHAQVLRAFDKAIAKLEAQV